MAKLAEPKTYDYEGWQVVLGDRESRRIGNNTYVERVGDHGEVAIRLHRTNVVTFRKDGAIDLNTGGWFTPTTKDRINAALPQRWYVASRKGVWFLFDRRNGHVAVAGFEGNCLAIPAEVAA